MSRYLRPPHTAIVQRTKRQEHRNFFGTIEIDVWIQVFGNTKPAPGTNGPLIPGDAERKAEAIRSKNGIPLLKPVVDDVLDISNKTGLPFEVKIRTNPASI
jgi:LDH2 family malate/lactate/ureidoglycolate dehydrogenase